MTAVALQPSDSVFLSYSTPDVATAAAVAAVLRPRVSDVFFAPDSMREGDSFIRQINGALQAFTGAVVIWSTHAARSKWVADELDALLIARNERRAPAYFVALDEAPVPELWRATQALRTTPARAAVDVLARLCGGSASTDAGSKDRLLKTADFDLTDAEIVGRVVCRVASELTAARSGTFVATLGNGQPVGITVNMDAVPTALVPLDGALRIIDALRERIQFLKARQLEPIGQVVSFEPQLRSAEVALADETQHIKPLLRVLLKQCVDMTP